MSGEPEGLQVVRTREALAERLAAFRSEGCSIGLVPTMGFLHEGHLSLVERAGELADVVALSVFVNPLQFGPGEDLEDYPRNLDRDVELAEQRGASLLFAPAAEVMYPEGPPLVRVSPGPMGERLCGEFRPGHFEGVLTVVARLFGLFRPDVAIFGRKDFQQAVLVRRMALDLELGVRIEVAPLVRETDGLALSSRNAYLQPDERSRAPLLFQALDEADRAFRAGERDPERLSLIVLDLLAETDLFRAQYAEVARPDTLRRPERAREGDVLAVAAYLGVTRLIDNVVLGAEAPDPRIDTHAVLPEEA